MRNIISLQLEQSGCSISLMVYSKCLVNIKVKRPARHTDVSAGRGRFSLQKHITIVERGFGNDRENTRGKNYSTWREWCASSATVIKMLRISISHIYRWWPLFKDVVITPHSSCRMRLHRGSIKLWMDDKDEWKSSSALSIWAELLYQTLNNRNTCRLSIQLFLTIQRPFGKHLWLLQYVLSAMMQQIFLMVQEGGVFSCMYDNYNMANWQLVNDCVCCMDHTSKLHYAKTHMIIHSYYFRGCPWVPLCSFPCLWFMNQVNKTWIIPVCYQVNFINRVLKLKSLKMKRSVSGNVPGELLSCHQQLALFEASLSPARSAAPASTCGLCFYWSSPSGLSSHTLLLSIYVDGHGSKCIPSAKQQCAFHWFWMKIAYIWYVSCLTGPCLSFIMKESVDISQMSSVSVTDRGEWRMFLVNIRAWYCNSTEIYQKV